MKKSDDATPQRTVTRSLGGPTATPVQAFRRLEIEHDAAPMTPGTTDALLSLVRGLVILPKDSAERSKVKKALANWLKELHATRSYRLFIKQMKEADAHHQRILAEKEQTVQRERYKRMIMKQRDANKRLRRAFVEGRNTSAGEGRKRVRAAISERGISYSGKRPIMIGKRAARSKAASSHRV